MKKQGMLYWITGLSGAGKTTIGNRLYYELRNIYDNVVLLDGDILKKIVGDHLGYSEEDRRERAKKYALLCKTLVDQGLIVICCTIAMYDEVRDWNRRENKGYMEIFLDVPKEILYERDQKGMYSQFQSGELRSLAGIDVNVEIPKNPDLVILNDGRFTVKECVDKILSMPAKYSDDFDRDVDYWNIFYESNPDIEQPSLFAKSIMGYLHKGSNLLELGCGNGRDSLFFASNGVNVTGIDASDKAIDRLQTNAPEQKASFICDDFVCAPALFAGQYDFCYSRFSLHAINDKQEQEVIKNVWDGLKKGGKFFIEVRSVHDDIYGLGEKKGKHSYIYNGHYRRFIVKEELEERLKNIGFTIDYSEEKRGFAPLGETDPPIIRIIASKNIN